jgi:hypothetical protein
MDVFVSVERQSLLTPGRKRKKKTGKLHKEELHTLQSSSNIVKVTKSRTKMGRTCNTHEICGKCVHFYSE